MKKVISALFATVLFTLYSCAQDATDKIGVNENGNFKITSDLEKIKSDWNILLKDQKNQTRLVDFKIVSRKDSKLDNEIYYILLGTNKDSTTKLATLLVLKDDGFYLSSYGKLESGGTVSCSGCAYSCNPEKFGNVWYCSGGCGSNCTKTVTVND